MSSGLFVVIEGPNRAGKSTLIREMSGYLGTLNADVVVTREPGGTPLGEGLRSVLKDSTMAAGAFATALVFNGGRKEHADKVITPAVDRGAIVICDRYYISTEIFQCILADGITNYEADMLRAIHRSFPQPDLTVFILPSAEVLDKRGGGAEADRFEGNPRELAAYKSYATEFSQKHPSVIIRADLATEGQSRIGEVVNHDVFARWIRSRTKALGIKAPRHSHLRCDAS